MDKYSQLRKTGKLSGTVKRARAIRKQRDTLQGTPDRKTALAVIPMGPPMLANVQTEAKASRPRAKNWIAPRATRDLQVRHTQVRAISRGRYSSRCRYERYEYCGVIRSAGMQTPKRLLFFIGLHSGIVMAGRGWKYGRDTVGIFVEKRSNRNCMHRYHVTADDCLGGWAQIVTSARRHITLQRELAKSNRLKPVHAQLREARRLKLHVRESDSIAAGNCYAGTRAFVAAHRLGVSVRIDVLERIATHAEATRKSQINRAIEYAARRCQTDLERGYCLLTR